MCVCVCVCVYVCVCVRERERESEREGEGDWRTHLQYAIYTRRTLLPQQTEVRLREKER